MQVVTNFINNALKFTNEGQIILEYRHKAESNEIEFAVDRHRYGDCAR